MLNENKFDDAPDELTASGFFWRERDGVKVLICRALEEKGFVNGFSTRLGGVSPLPEAALNLAGFDFDSAENIFENRRRFLRVFDADFQLASAWQVHGDGVKLVESDEDIANSEEKFDALISRRRGVLIGVKTADCVPLLFGDTKTGAFAAVHAGWRGTAASIAVKTLAKMSENFGTKPQNVIAAIGAAASCRNYEVGAEVIEAFQQNFPQNYEKFFTPTRENHALADILSANKTQLEQNGVEPQNIFLAPFCTMERTDLFFSHRADRRFYEQTGRLLSVIGRT